MTYNITLTANHQSLTAKYLPLAAESVQYLTAKVAYETDDWTGREIKAMFEHGHTVYEVPVTGGEITANQQLNLTAGDWRVWLIGNSARDGDVIPRITTNVAHIRVAPTGGTEGNPFPTVPPTVEEQLRADMGNLADLTTEDKSSLVAAINEAAASGGSKDAVTYTPQTLTEEQKSQARTNIGAEKAGTAYTKPASGIPKSDLEQSVQTSLDKADTAILYNSQPLTTEQQKQARANIGVGQPDWNQNDSTQPDYVKNRPFYTGTEEMTLTFNPDNTYETYSGMLHKISNDPISLDKILASKTSLVITDSGETIDGIVTEENVTPGEGFYTALVQSSAGGHSAQFISIYEAQTEENFGAAVPVGLYVPYTSTSSVYVSQITYQQAKVHPVDKKFIPDMDSVILNSSTPDSTKKFKITVDDSGEPTITDESDSTNTWKAVDMYEKPDTGIPKSDLEQSVQTSLDKADTAISLGLTSATPGQIIKVKAVQDGKPTEWEAVDMPGGGGVQPDWNQNDSTQPDYVKNRPFYTGDPVETVLVEESTVSFAENHGLYMAQFPSTFEATVGETYKVSWDGAAYECTCVDFNNTPAIGNLSIAGAGSDTGEPFLMVVDNGLGIIIGTADTSASHTVSISATVVPVVKIDPKYIRDMYYTGDPVETILVEESTVAFAEDHGLYMAQFPSTFEATVGETYKVYWDGTTYECACVNFNNIPAIGNLSIAGGGSDTGEPFVIGIFEVGRIDITTQNTSASHTISISGLVSEVVKIDPKYLPDTIATKSEVGAAQTTADDAQSTANAAKTAAETAQSTADTALDRADTAQTTADTALDRADTAKTTADGCVKTNNSGLFQIYLGDNSYFSGSNTGGEAYYAFHQKNVTDTPIVLSIGTNGGTALDISVTPSTSPTVKITPPTYIDKIADIEIGGYSIYPRPQITGLGGITMYSSTSGSTKKFKITVDDSGTLKATEVS